MTYWISIAGAITVVGSFAQEILPSLEWESLFAAEACEVIAIVQPAEGGFLLGGRVYGNPGGFGQNDCALIRIDDQGRVLWHRTYGGSGDDSMQAVQQTRDSGFVFVGYSNSSPSGNKESPPLGMHDAWIVKVDFDGRKQWEYSIGGSGDDFGLSIWQEISERSYLFVGSTASASGSINYWLQRIAFNGELLGVPQSLGEGAKGRSSRVHWTTDRGFAFAGASIPALGEGPFGEQDAWLMKLGSGGNKLWERFVGGSANEIFLAMDQTSDGGFILGGRSSSVPSGNKLSKNFGGHDYWVVKMGVDGNKEWDRSYGTSTLSVEEVRVIRQATNGDYLFGGYFGGRSKLVNLDPNGVQKWELSLDSRTSSGERYIVEIHDLRQTSDGGFILAGRHDYPHRVPDIGCIWGAWVAKIGLIRKV
jgi:hypothetical protein